MQQKNMGKYQWNEWGKKISWTKPKTSLIFEKGTKINRLLAKPNRNKKIG